MLLSRRLATLGEAPHSSLRTEIEAQEGRKASPGERRCGRPHRLISEADMIKTIPLKKLIPSPRNVRRSTDAHADLQLKADIEPGVAPNLVVAPAKKPRGAFTVEAGGRACGR
jgi:hypothetical protein